MYDDDVHDVRDVDLAGERFCEVRAEGNGVSVHLADDAGDHESPCRDTNDSNPRDVRERRRGLTRHVAAEWGCGAISRVKQLPGRGVLVIAEETYDVHRKSPSRSS